MARGFRARLTITVIALVVTSASVVATTGYVLVRDSLLDQLVADALDSTEFAVVELASPQVLPVDADRAAFEASGLPERFLRRDASALFVDFGDGDPYASQPEFLATPEVVSTRTRDLMAHGRYGYELVEVGGKPLLVVAARRPSGPPDFYLYHDASIITETLGTLARFLLLGVGAVVALAVLTAGAVARGVLRPVRTAGAAAQQLAAGDLATRVTVGSDDEFGRMAEAFNLMAASLQSQINALEEAEHRERRFVADVSHELRTPLTGLYNEAQLLEPHLAALPVPARRVAELMTADVDRLRHLVDELLEISRLEAGVNPASRVATDIGQLIAALVAGRLPSARTIGPAPGVVLCNRHGLERVIANLLDNAAVHAPGAVVEVEAQLAGSELALSVTDHGPGVDDESLPHLFDRFYKADASRQGGSGLGLAIAWRHAHRMGGTVTVSRAPVPSSGLRFELLVPVTLPLHVGDPAEIRHDDDGPHGP
jgi:two-component system, OmpR family, sensor histidine kinase MtrB